MFGDFVVLRDPYSHYIAPNVYSVAVQQCFTNWNTLHQYKFVGNGARYMDTLSLYSTRERQIQLSDNFVFLYCPTVPFRSDDPFATIDKITHVWYKVVHIQERVLCFDKIKVLLNAVQSIVLPLHIRCEYIGTYLLFTPPLPIDNSSSINHRPTPLLVDLSGPVHSNIASSTQGRSTALNAVIGVTALAGTQGAQITDLARNDD